MSQHLSLAPQVECLRGLDAHLAAHGPFIGGAAPCATDMAVWPRLYHMQVRERGSGGQARVAGWRVEGRARAVCQPPAGVVVALLWIGAAAAWSLGT